MRARPLQALVAAAILAACSSAKAPPPAADADDDGDDAGAIANDDRDAAASEGGDAAARWTAPRAEVDQPDDRPGAYQAHVLYVEPSDRAASPGLDVDGTLRRSITAFNRWLGARADGATLRLDTHGGAIDVTHVKLAIGESELALGETMTPAGPRSIHQRLEALLTPAFADPKKIYLVYYDGLAIGTCGDSPRPGRMPMAYVGGIWSSTYLDAAVSAGAGTLDLYDPVVMNVPPPPFAAHLGAEPVQVTQIVGTGATLAAPLTGAHPRGELLKPDDRPPDCRGNPYSRDGVEWTYATFVQLHEVVHALGMVADGAPEAATPPIAPGHLGPSSAAGLADLMYQGAIAGPCGDTVADAVASPCELDPGHRNYFKLPAGSPLVDLAKSVFLEPSAADATLPPGW